MGVKIGIVGLGFVGTAVANSYANTSVELRICDTAIANSVSVEEMVVERTAAIFLCLPTPALSDGSCDTSILNSVLEQLLTLNFEGVVISKSTAPPEFYAKWENTKLNLAFVPEFLRAASANEDYLNPDIVVIGAKYELWSKVHSILLKSNMRVAKKFNYTSIRNAAVFKYTANAFLASKVVFANSIKEYCTAIGADWNEVATLARQEPRLGISHWAVPGPDGELGYGGACFPKDLQALIASADMAGVRLPLLRTVHQVNQCYRKSSK